jgi:pimeloyl-ACP methyl ester carboxylesterase
MNGSCARFRDAVVIVPGIMGSELTESTTGKVLWGLSDPRWYVSAWTSGASLKALALDDDEQAGRYGRVTATRLLRFPAFAPFLAGHEPYTRLVKGLRAVAAHPDAVIEFPYDWRLPVAHNATLLADAAHRHLLNWREQVARIESAGHGPTGDEPRLVLVAHSMGGLLARHLALVPGMAEEIRATVTLGTPFFGAPKAVQILATGRGTPVRMPRSRLRELARRLPGLYDLLPVYRCVSTEAGPSTGARRLTPQDVADMGASAELAARSFAWHEQLSSFPLVGHIQVVGAVQPTVQALTIKAGTVTGYRHTLRLGAAGVDRVDMGGDGTVPRESAQLPALPAMPLAQSHGAIAATSEALLIVQDVLTDRRTGPWQGAGELGLDLPDVVAVGRPFEIRVTGADRALDATCRVIDVATGLQVDAPRLMHTGDGILASADPRSAGLYRVSAEGGGSSRVSQLLMAAPAA